MTTETDILGRAPMRKPRHVSDDYRPEDDWRGEHLWKVPRAPSGGQKFSIRNARRKASKIRKYSK